MKLVIIVMSAIISLGLLSPVEAGDWELKPRQVAKWHKVDILGKSPYGMVVLVKNPNKKEIWPDYAIVTVHRELGLVAYAYLDRNNEVVVVGYNPKERRYQIQPKLEKAYRNIKEFLLAKRKEGGT